jgi:hypothetical protein
MLRTSKPVFPLLMVLLALLFSGCSQVVYPRGAIPVKMDVVGSMDAGKVVSFINGVPDAKLTLVATQGSQKYFVDYKHWTGAIVSQLEDELRKRGAQVKPESEVGFKVAVESVGLLASFGGPSHSAVSFGHGLTRLTGHGQRITKEIMLLPILIGR